MFNIYMCEDDEMQLEHLSGLIEEYLHMTDKNACFVSKQTNPENLLLDMEHNEDVPSVFFLDVQLDGYSMNGFQLAKEVQRKCPHSYLVFLTSKDELAYEVFEQDIEVVDYIVKQPEFFLHHSIDDKLFQRLNAIFEKIEKKEREKKERKLLVECGGRVVEIPIKEVLYIQSLKVERQLEICCENQRLNIRESLRKMYDKLGEGFLYANKSCIVQIDKIREIDKNNRYLALQNGRQIEVSYREMKNVVRNFIIKDKTKEGKN